MLHPFILALFGGFVLAGSGLAAYSAAASRAVEAAFPPVGDVVDLDGLRVHFKIVSARQPNGGAPPILVLHGASGNLREPDFGFASALAADRDVILFDRPGLGWSEHDGRPALDLPSGQADIAAALMAHLGYDRAVVLGHSYGASVATSFALRHPDQTAGLVALAPATHPWPGGIKWYYRLAGAPVIGHLFTATLTQPVGRPLVGPSVQSVFAPNPVPEGYAEETGAALILTPARFRANARNIDRLFDYVTAISPTYARIAAPTLIVTGDRDTVVLPEIHSKGLIEALPDARLVTLEGIGHMPHHAARARVVAEIETLLKRIDAEAAAE